MSELATDRVVSYQRNRILVWIGFFAFWSLSGFGAAVSGSPGSIVLSLPLAAPLAYLLRRLRTLGPALAFDASGVTDLRFGDPVTVREDEILDVEVRWLGRSPWPKVVDVTLSGDVPYPTISDLVLGRSPTRRAPSMRLWGTLVDASPDELAQLLDGGSYPREQPEDS